MSIRNALIALPFVVLAVPAFAQDAAIDKDGDSSYSLVELKWSGKFGQRAKVNPTRLNGYKNGKATEFFRQV